MFVPVVDSDGNPLMPTTPARARQWVKSGKATPFWRKGIWCVRLNIEPSARNTSSISVGVDPGSKREGFTVKSHLHTYLNVQAHAVDWVKKRMSIRRELRRGRRRSCPCRQRRPHNNRNCGLPPSTKARWDWKLRILRLFSSLFPVTHVVCEDVHAAPKKGWRQWNRGFSAIQMGKSWFYDSVATEIGHLVLVPAYETFCMREQLGLRKSKSKLSSGFNSHCVDSWCLANSITGGHSSPDNTKVIEFIPLQFKRRQTHYQCLIKNGSRVQYGTTRSNGFKRGSIVRHPTYGVCRIGGYSKAGITLTERDSKRRIYKRAKPDDIQHLAYSSFLVH